MVCVVPMLVPRVLSALFVTTALSCSPKAQVEPSHTPAPGNSTAVGERSECSSLTERLCQDLGPSPACQAVRSGAPNLTTIKCVEMTQHYSEVLADLQKMNQRFKPLPVAVFNALVAADGPGLGDPTAPIQLLVFWDYECSYCAKAIGALSEVHRRYPNEVRVSVSQFPLPFHPHAALAAEAALSAHAQGQFWSFSELVFAHQEALERADLLRYASQVELDLARVAQSLDNHEFATLLEHQVALGAQAGVPGTPTLYVNLRPCSNPTTVDGVLACIDEARTAPAKAN